MPLLNLPNELLRNISKYLGSGRDINAIAQANYRLYCLLDSYLYRYNIRQSGSSALLWAARHGQEATAQKLLREKANIQATNNKNQAPLLLVSRTVPMLASAKHTLRPPIGQLTSARRLAASCTHALVARTTTIQDNLSHQLAAKNGHKNVVKLLVDTAADVNAQRGRYGSALQAASQGGHAAVTQIFFARHGCHVGDRNQVHLPRGTNSV
jgi:ankyrin repeat protein